MNDETQPIGEALLRSRWPMGLTAVFAAGTVGAYGLVLMVWLVSVVSRVGGPYGPNPVLVGGIVLAALVLSGLAGWMVVRLALLTVEVHRLAADPARTATAVRAWLGFWNSAKWVFPLWAGAAIALVLGIGSM